MDDDDPGSLFIMNNNNNAFYLDGAVRFSKALVPGARWVGRSEVCDSLQEWADI